MAFTEALRLLIDADTRGDVTTPDRQSVRASRRLPGVM
jgi:hypothetical protein